MASDPSPRTRAAQALGWIEPATRGIAPSIHPSTTFQRPVDREELGLTYARDESPTQTPVEALLASLEGGTSALLFSSGMAATAAVLSTLRPGERLIAPTSMYWAARAYMAELPERRGVDVVFVPTGDLAALENALTGGKTRLVWLETPSNPLLEITDIAAASRLAHGAGARVAVDSTVATPVLSRPLSHGADFVVHSATKQLNGHSDVLAGAVVAREPSTTWEGVRWERKMAGAVLGPFEAWLLLRGMRTLYLRVEASARSAQRVAEFLVAHPRVTQALYPGLPGHPGRDIAARQMEGGFGPLLSVRIAGGEASALRVLGALRLFHHATSLGGVESFVEHRASVEGPASRVPRDLLRLSIGIEDSDDLVRDLTQALEHA